MKTTKKDIILLAAKEAFREYGVDNTSMDKLSALANVSKSTVYQYFSSKEALVIELLGDLWQKAMDHAEEQILNISDIRQQLEHLLLSEINLFTSEEYLSLSKVTIGYFLYRDCAVDKKECIQRMVKKETKILEWLQRMVDSKQLLISDISYAEAQLQSLISHPAYWCQAVGIAPLLTEDEKQQLVQRTADFFLSYYQKPNF
ncbi:TetR family transcriptional regulator [Aliivibrio fischeri]|uniref:TetR/AcrR family transcriptional regulator n=1 Tax=Aliivibrio fischeri TaxID=668 RepID=UPI0012D946F8|nr:TetR/AcrR family transcriptional regulator [Aliivibrio fischeri]MUH96253.1 TetR family transcriptional regulator [Aliivibrio fischeri]MUI62507.1 TetR family transcriptional regulator [Aliivibrio fischeri]